MIKFEKTEYIRKGKRSVIVNGVDNQYLYADIKSSLTAWFGKTEVHVDYFRAGNQIKIYFNYGDLTKIKELVKKEAEKDERIKAAAEKEKQETEKAAAEKEKQETEKEIIDKIDTTFKALNFNLYANKIRVYKSAVNFIKSTLFKNYNNEKIALYIINKLNKIVGVNELTQYDASAFNKFLNDLEGANTLSEYKTLIEGREKAAKKFDGIKKLLNSDTIEIKELNGHYCFCYECGNVGGAYYEDYILKNNREEIKDLLKSGFDFKNTEKELIFSVAAEKATEKNIITVKNVLVALENKKEEIKINEYIGNTLITGGLEKNIKFDAYYNTIAVEIQTYTLNTDTTFTEIKAAAEKGENINLRDSAKYNDCFKIWFDIIDASCPTDTRLIIEWIINFYNRAVKILEKEVTEKEAEIKKKNANIEYTDDDNKIIEIKGDKKQIEYIRQEIKKLDIITGDNVSYSADIKMSDNNKFVGRTVFTKSCYGYRLIKFQFNRILFAGGATEKDIKNVIRHEYSHHIAEKNNKAFCGHGVKWVEACKIVGCIPERVFTKNVTTDSYVTDIQTKRGKKVIYDTFKSIKYSSSKYSEYIFEQIKRIFNSYKKQAENNKELLFYLYNTMLKIADIDKIKKTDKWDIEVLKDYVDKCNTLEQLHGLLIALI